MVIEWINAMMNPPPQSFDVLLLLKDGQIVVGYNSEDEGYYLSYGDLLVPIEQEVSMWALLEKIAPQMPLEPLITHDSWIKNAAKKGMLK